MKAISAFVVRYGRVSVGKTAAEIHRTHTPPRFSGHSPPDKFGGANRVRAASPLAPLALLLAVLVSGFGGGAWAETGVCSEKPASTERVSCIEEDNAEDIELDFDGVDISTTTANQSGTAVEVWKAKTSMGSSTGNIDVDFTNGSVTTTGDNATGINAVNEGTGDIKINVEDSTFSTTSRSVYGTANANIDIDVSDSTITTKQISAEGVGGQIAKTGDLDIDLKDTDVTTSGTSSNGVAGYFIDQGGATPTGTLDIGIVGGTISTSGVAANAVEASHGGSGDINVNINGATLKTTGITITDPNDNNYDIPSHGVVAWQAGTTDGKKNADGNIDVRLTNTQVSTSGDGAHGVWAWREVNGNVDVRFTGGSVSTDGRSAYGVYSLLGTSIQSNEGTGTLRIEGRGGDITTNGVAAYGVYGYAHDTTSNTLVIDLQNVNVRTESTDPWDATNPSTGAHGVYGRHRGADKLVINLRGGSVSTKGRFSTGLYGRHEGTGDIAITTGGGHSITTEGRTGYGIYARHSGTGDIAITAGGGHSITTEGISGYGLYARHQGTGDIDIRFTGGSVSTDGRSAHGVYGRRSDPAAEADTRAIRIEGRNSDITTKGVNAHGVYGYAYDTMASTTLEIDLQNVNVRTKSTDAWDADDLSTYSYGVYGLHRSAGNLDITANRGSVSTKGDISYGLYGRHLGSGDIAITTGGGHSISTTGDSSHGLYARHQGTTGDVSIIVEDSNIETSGDAAHGILAIGRGGRAVNILIRNAVIRATGEGSHGILVQGAGTQTVTVGSEVWGGSGGAAGILLVGGGRVTIRPDGRVGAPSGIAVQVIRADENDQTETPRLYLDLALDGRLPEEALGGRVVNDGGTTALAVNGMPVFDSAAEGARNVWVPNGAWNVRATGTDLSTLAFARVVAPRAAVYEALPGVLLRLDEPGGIGDEGRLRSPDTPVWVRVAGGAGSYRADSATVDARYSHVRYSVESGMDFPLDYELTGWHGLTGWAGVRMISGSAEVSAPTGGGRIEAAGYGLTGGLAWKGEDDWYGTGRLSLTRYSADLFSAARGGLKSGVSGMIHALDLEGGRRFDLDLGVKTRLTARGVLRGSGVSLDEFNDGLFSHVSIKQADRLAAGAGVAVETGLLPSDGVDRLVLRGSLDAEQALSAGTKVDVSGTALESKAGGTGFGVGFGGAYRIGGYTLGGSVEAGGLGSDDTAYSGRLEARMAF